MWGMTEEYSDTAHVNLQVAICFRQLLNFVKYRGIERLDMGAGLRQCITIFLLDESQPISRFQAF